MPAESSSKINALVIAEDPQLRQDVSDAVRELPGFTCEWTTDSSAALEYPVKPLHDCILLGLPLPNHSLPEVLKRLRETAANVILLVLTPLEAKEVRLEAMKAGADDFVLLPFAKEELQTRVQAALIRSRSQARSVLSYGPLEMDIVNRRVWREGRAITLTPTEFRVLELLLRHQGQVVTRRTLCDSLWHQDWEGVTNVIEVHINRLRSKLNQHNQPQLIQTVRGKGYSLQLPRELREVVSRAHSFSV